MLLSSKSDNWVGRSRSGDRALFPTSTHEVIIDLVLVFVQTQASMTQASMTSMN